MIRLRAAFLPLLLASSWLLACGETTSESACSLFDNGDGTRTLKCGEETLIIPGTGDGTRCVKSPAADGGAVVACTDGTTIVLDEHGNVVHRGAGGVVGRVTLFGETDHAGTVVRALGTLHSTVTDDKGDFYLAGLDAGIYDLIFERPGWEPLRHRNTIAVGGLLYLEPMLLRRGRMLGAGSSAVIVSPNEETLLTREGRALWLHRVDRLEPLELSPHVPLDGDNFSGSNPRYDPSGETLVFFENLDPVERWARLRRHDVKAKSSITLAERALRATPLEGGAVLLWRVPAEVKHGPVATAEVLVVYPDGEELELGTGADTTSGNWLAPGGKAFGVETDAGLVMVEVGARRHFSPGSGAKVAAWSRDGRQAVLASAGAGEFGWALYHLDLETHATVLLADDALFGESPALWRVEFSPDGSRLLFLDDFAPDIEGSPGERDGWYPYYGVPTVVDTRTFEVTPVADPSPSFVEWLFAPDGSAVLYRRGAGTLVHWDLAGNRLTPLGSAGISSLFWAARWDRFAFVEGDSCRLIRQERGGSPAIFQLPRCEAIRFLPDGERTAVLLRNDGGTRDLRLWSGTEVGPLVAELPGDALAPDIRFADDGSAVLWLDGTPQDARVVHVLGIEDGLRAVLPPNTAYWAEFSPDATFVVARGGSTLHELSFHERSTGITTPVDSAARSVLAWFEAFVVYSIDPDVDPVRAGWWLARYPRTP